MQLIWLGDATQSNQVQCCLVFGAHAKLKRYLHSNLYFWTSQMFFFFMQEEETQPLQTILQVESS
jgi:hypothetical protein